MTNVYNTPDANVMGETNTDYEYVGFWMRVAASILDNLWLGVAMFILIVVLAATGLVHVSATETSLNATLIQLLVPMIVVVALWSRFASTPGKMAFKAKILDADTFEPVSTSRLVLRYIGYFVSMLPFFLGFIWVGIDERKQGFHDKIARTVVIMEDESKKNLADFEREFSP